MTRPSLVGIIKNKVEVIVDNNTTSLEDERHGEANKDAKIEDQEDEQSHDKDDDHYDKLPGKATNILTDKGINKKDLKCYSLNRLIIDY